MPDEANALTYKLLDLMEKTGYPIVQHNGQRKYGPPTDWSGPPPPRGSEVFIGKLPREIFEDELVPIFSKPGKIYEMRLMMDFSGSNRGYAFVTYCSPSVAQKAIKELDGHEVRRGRYIGVVMSVDNCRLFVGGIPKNKTRDEIFEELSKRVSGIVNVYVYKNFNDPTRNRGFAFVEFTSHRAAAMARRALVPGCVKLWDKEVQVDWAEPEPYVDKERMEKVKVLYARNFAIDTLPDVIQSIFESAIDTKIERIKKIYDYAFIHFHEREHAQLAMSKLQGAVIDGSAIEISWAKPVDRDLYRIQKMRRGNAKFNHGLDLSQTLLLYKHHLEKKEYAKPVKEDEGIGSMSGSPTDGHHPNEDFYRLAPAKLEAMCKGYMWSVPMYDYSKYIDASGAEVWIGRVDLPYVGPPLLQTPRHVGPLATRPCFSMQQAQVEAAENALHYLKMLRLDVAQRAPSALANPVYQPIMQPVPTCVSPYYPAVYSRPQSTLPMTVPTAWLNRLSLDSST